MREHVTKNRKGETWFFKQPRGCFYYAAISLTGFLLACAHIQAGLAWEKKTFDYKAGASDKEVRVSFLFTNAGKKSVEIKQIRTCCGCMRAETNQRVYKPGEKGQINVCFQFGSRKGLQQKSIIIETDDADNPQDVLLLHVEIPDVITLSKKQLTWEMGDPLEEQEFEIINNAPQQVKVSSVRSSGEFIARLEEIQVDKTYRVVVKPLATDKPSQSLVHLELSEAHAIRTVDLQALVQ